MTYPTYVFATRNTIGNHLKVSFGLVLCSVKIIKKFIPLRMVLKYINNDNFLIQWSPLLNMLRERIFKKSGLTFNSMLANLYRNEKDSVVRTT